MVPLSLDKLRDDDRYGTVGMIRRESTNIADQGVKEFSYLLQFYGPSACCVKESLQKRPSKRSVGTHDNKYRLLILHRYEIGSRYVTD
jgi:hypothetical protein